MCPTIVDLKEEGETLNPDSAGTSANEAEERLQKGPRRPIQFDLKQNVSRLSKLFVPQMHLNFLTRGKEID